MCLRDWLALEILLEAKAGNLETNKSKPDYESIQPK